MALLMKTHCLYYLVGKLGTQIVVVHAVYLLPDKPACLEELQVQGSIHFCPTSLASSLCGGGVTGSGSGVASAGSSSTGGSSSGVTGGHIIVESNYRVGGFPGKALFLL